MNIHPWVWLVTVGVLLIVLAIDLFVIGRRPHEPSMREASLWVSFYVALAVLFGMGVLVVSGPRYGAEFFAGWITEYSLSIDNLFVFVIIMSWFAVPREYQQTVLLWASCSHWSCAGSSSRSAPRSSPSSPGSSTSSGRS